ncbi:hypothetical protein DFJ74DRAFT_683824 [Hyaloraphidium curvatum]|nr:hypothetical protein DFJ74DRAFT_683824 [Hyaloraphidium curvatum]
MSDNMTGSPGAAGVGAAAEEAAPLPPTVAADAEAPLEDSSPDDLVVNVPPLPNELISSVMEILGRRNWKHSLLEFMLASKRCYVLGLRELAGDLVLGPREGFGPEKLELLARGYEYAGEPVPRLVKKLKIAPGITWSAKRLKVLRKILVGVERFEYESHGAKIMKTIWNLLEGARELTWVKLALYQDAAEGFDGTSRFPPSVRDLVLSLSDFWNKAARQRRYADTSALRNMIMERAPNLQRLHFAGVELLKDCDWISCPGIRNKLFTIKSGFDDVVPFANVPGFRIPHLRLDSWSNVLFNWDLVFRLGVEHLETASLWQHDFQSLIFAPGTPRAVKRFVIRRNESSTPLGLDDIFARIRTRLAAADIGELIVVFRNEGFSSERAHWDSLGVKWANEQELESSSIWTI